MASEQASLFEAATYIPSDSIFELTKKYLADGNPQKVNLGQGTYRDEEGKPWILPSVQEAKKRVSGCGHEYLQIAGLREFRDRASDMVFHGTKAQREDRIAHVQALSGTGSLFLAARALRQLNPSLDTVYITSPTWAPHDLLFSSQGFKVVSVPYYRDGAFDFPMFISTLRTASAGSVVVLHTCAHNPTGCDPSKEQWKEIAQVIQQKRIFPIFDSAYLGFNSGSVDEDAWAIRHVVEDLNLEAAVCLSFAKNMGLYGERIGLVAFATSTTASTRVVQSVLERCQRATVSNPPRYGAEIASVILGSEDLRKQWEKDLLVMSGRIKGMRQKLYESLVALGE